MAVENRQKRKAKLSFIARVLMHWICITFLAWVILISWALIIWVNTSFNASFKAVERMTSQQAFIFEEFSVASFTPWVADFIKPTWHFTTLHSLENAKKMKDEITEGVVNRLEDFTNEQAPLAPQLQEVLQDLQLKAQQFWLLLCSIARLLLIKFAIILASIPLFVLAIIAGLVDGLNQRAIRTASLGRESTYVFHKSIPLAKKLFLLVLGLWLAIPHNLPPSPIFVSLAVLLSLMVSVTSSRFKKYL